MKRISRTPITLTKSTAITYTIATVAEQSQAILITGLSPGQSFTYGVATYTTSYGTHESPQTTNAGSTFTVGLDASDGVTITGPNWSWNNIASICDEIRIERSIRHANKEEIAILSDNATAYNDQDGIPGYPYTYSVTPIVANDLF
jgi:hypothetical protein